jgi:hypothetical protein
VNYKSFLVTEAGDARNFNSTEMQAVIKFPPARQGTEGNSHHSDTNIGEHAPSYATKNWLPHFECGDFSTCDVPHPGRPKTVTTLEITDQIHKLILEDQKPDFR